MKRLSRDRKDWQLRRQRIGQRSELRVVGYALQRLRIADAASTERWRTSVLKMPRDLVAETDQQREKLRTLIDSAFRLLEQPRRRLKFDFTPTTRLYPGGTLIFLAYLELILKFFPGRVAARCVPQSLAAQLLRHFGVADALGLGRSFSEPRHTSVLPWKYLTGKSADGQSITELLNFYRQEHSALLPEGLYDVLSEALTNVRHHAYPSGAEVPEELKRWWLFSRLDPPQDGGSGSLYIAVYDIGVGIQETMRSKLSHGEVVLEAADPIAQLLRIGSSRKLLDRLLLERAIEHRRSSTGLPFRGRGLPEMRDFVLATQKGRLYIISGQAQYACVAGESTSKTYSCKSNFYGTLIIWNIELQLKEPQP